MKDPAEEPNHLEKHADPRLRDDGEQRDLQPRPEQHRIPTRDGLTFCVRHPLDANLRWVRNVSDAIAVPIHRQETFDDLRGGGGRRIRSGRATSPRHLETRQRDRRSLFCSRRQSSSLAPKQWTHSTVSLEPAGGNAVRNPI